MDGLFVMLVGMDTMGFWSCEETFFGFVVVVLIVVCGADGGAQVECVVVVCVGDHEGVGEDVVDVVVVAVKGGWCSSSPPSPSSSSSSSSSSRGFVPGLSVHSAVLNIS